MAKPKAAKQFNGMSYTEVQRHNTQRRAQISPTDQKWLKQNGYRNVGWENIVRLYQQITDLIEKSQIADLSLEELFLEADRIGQPYQTAEEIADFNQQLAQTVDAIATQVDRQFPDTEIEIIDYGSGKKRSPKVRR
ncbi:MAG: hypothetical protein MUF49_02115 [Oculatellaceae cyanobacterium Prado106]|nr:hypothetical protein [Oculatellaceae cyanobacterium Prado106]